MNQPLPMLTAAIIASLALISGCQNKTPEELIAAARQDIQAGKQQEAIVNLKTALQEQPGNVDARILLAQSMQARGEWQASEDELDKAAKRGGAAEIILPMRAQALLKQEKNKELIDLEIPKTGIGSTAYATILARRGMAYLSMGNPEMALTTIQEGEKLLANAGHTGLFEPIQLAKAGLAVYNKEHDKALDLLAAMERENPSSTDISHIKANLLLQLNRTDDALKEYQHIVQLSPGDLPALGAITDIQITRGALAAAEKTLAAIESRQPDNLLGKMLRASLDMRKGGEDNLKKANASIQQVLRVLPDQTASLILAAEINERLGNHEASLKFASRVLAKIPNQFESTLIVARSHLRRGEAAVAARALEQLAGIYKDNARVLGLLGEARIASGQHAAGTEILNKAAALAPKSAEIAILQARGYRARGMLDQAYARLREASKLDATQGLADEILFQWLMEQQQPRKALEAAETYNKKFPNSSTAMNLKAVAMLAMKQKDEAVAILEQITRADPAYYPAAANLASLDVRDGNIGNARKRFQTVLDKNPRNGEAMQALANLALKEKNPSDFVRWMERAIKNSPSQLEYRARLIEHHLATNNIKQAQAEAVAAVNANPGSTAAMLILAKTQMATGDKQRALISFAQAASMSPKSAAAAMQLGMAQLELGQLDEARTNLERARALGSDSIELLGSLLSLEVKSGNHTQALAHARTLTQRLPNSAVGHDREGEILLRLGRPAEAIGPFRKALDLTPSPNRVIRLHQALLASKRGAEAEKLIAGWINKYPKVDDLRLYLADTRAKAGLEKEAIALYEAILAQSPGNVPALNNLALLLRGSDHARALKLAEKAHQYAPGEVNVRDTLGLLLTDTADKAKAIKLLEEVVKLSPENPTFRYHLASAYATSGRTQNVIDTLRPALSARYYFPERNEALRLFEQSGGK